MARRKLYNTDHEHEQSRIFQIILYPDSESYNCDEVIDNATKYFPEYAYILHDEDIWTELDKVEYEKKHKDKEFPYKVGDKKKPHIHLLISKEERQNIQLGLAARLLNIPSNYVEKVYERNGAFQYLTHVNYPEKHQYNIEDIVTNIQDIRKKYFQDKDVIVKASKIIDFITTFEGFIYVTDVAKWSLTMYCWDEFRRGQHLFTAIINEHNLQYQKNKEI